nr:retrovirus-related Pol polyprotein from transposon TNT 1-94 [Tanacetum cinerariifolium]
AKLKEERYEYMIRYSALCDNDKQHRKNINEQEILFDKMSHQLVEMNNNVLRLQEKILEKETKILELEGCVSNKDVEIEKCLERLNECENKLHRIEQTNQTIHMIMPSKDTLYNGRKGIGFENSSYFKKAKDLRPSLYDEKVIGLGYTLMFLINSDEALEIEMFKRARENKIKFAYDFGNLNASCVNEKKIFLDDYFQEQISSLKPYVPNVILEKIIIDLEDEVVNLLEKEKVNWERIRYMKSKSFESSEKVCSESKNQSENDCMVIEKECDKEENPKVIALRIFELNVSHCVSPISMSKSSCDSKNVEIKLKRKRHLDTFSSVRRPRHRDVIWKKKGVGQFCDKGLEVAFQKSTCFVQNEDGVDLLTGDRSSNLYAISLNEVASNSLTCLLAKASSSQSWLWHQRLSHLNFTTINNLVKNNLVQGLPKIKFEKDHLYSACEQGKIHRKHHKSKTTFASNKPLYLLHMDLCRPMRVQSINGKRYVLVIVDDYSWYTWRIRTDNGTEFKNKTLAKFFDDVGITQQFSVVRTPQQNGVVERRNRTLVEAARTMLKFA